MDIYIIERAPSGNVARHFSGTDADTVTAQMAILTTNPYDVVDQAAYDAAVAALQPVK